MSLLKVPVVIILTLGLKAMLTPPHPPPAKDEMIETTKIDIFSVRRARFAIAHTIQALVAAAEVAAILALIQPSSSLLQRILPFCTFKGGRPDRFCLTALSTLGAILWAGGAVLRLRTYRDLGRFFRYEISIQKDHQLITNGLYAYVRHPAYTGMLLTNVGWVLWNGAEGSWVRESGFLDSPYRRILLVLYALFVIFPTSAVTLSRMSNEDKALRKKFGKDWDQWAARVPYSVIPGIY